MTSLVIKKVIKLSLNAFWTAYSSTFRDNKNDHGGNSQKESFICIVFNM